MVCGSLVGTERGLTSRKGERHYRYTYKNEIDRPRVQSLRPTQMISIVEESITIMFNPILDGCSSPRLGRGKRQD